MWPEHLAHKSIPIKILLERAAIERSRMAGFLWMRAPCKTKIRENLAQGISSGICQCSCLDDLIVLGATLARIAWDRGLLHLKELQ